MIIEFSEQEVAALIELLNRVQIQGREAGAVMVLLQKLTQAQPIAVAPNGAEPND